MNIRKEEKLDSFFKRQIVRIYCKEQITDDKYVLMSHPEFPNDISQILYFHSKGECNPRHRFLKVVRE
jgi:hypothetical protein